MKLLRVIHSADPANGGPIEGVLQMNRALRELGHTITTVTMDAPDAPCCSVEGESMVALGPGSGTYGYARRLRPWLEANAPHFDAITVEGLWQYLSVAVRAASARANTPYLVFPHGMLDPWFKQRYPAKHLKKLLYWLAIEYRVLRDAKAVLFTTDEERRLAAQSFRPYTVNGVTIGFGTALPVTADGQDGERFFTSFPQLRGKRLVLFLGRIHEKKGCDLLLEGFGHVAGHSADLQLVMAGPDPQGLQSRLMTIAVEKGFADRVTWTGMLGPDIKWSALRAAEVFALPSHQENFGVAVVEALAVGTPVLISDKVNIHDVIVADGAGFSDHDDLAGTQRCLARWLELDPAEKLRMRQRARESFLKRFEMRSVATRFAALLGAREQ